MKKSTHPSQRGFSLVELMVGITVALIGLLIITGVLINSSRQKQTTSSGADAQTAGSVAAYMLERDIRMAGFGVNFSSMLGCTIHGYDERSTPARSFSFTNNPIEIVAGSATTSDSLTITYGNADSGMGGPRLTQSHTGDDTNYKVDNRFGFHEGNVIVISEDGVDNDGDGIDDCTLAQVTGVPSASGQTDNIVHTSGNFTNVFGVSTPSRYNKPGGLGIPYTTKAKVYNLGDLPANKTFAIANGELTLIDSMRSTTAQSVAENIVFLRAQYGKDTNSDGTVDTFDQTAPSSANGWKQVTAIRFAIAARSHNRETEMVTATPLTLLPSITLPSGATIAAQTLALSDENRHYRYKVYSAFVPLRNQIWVPE
jgi:type IV pilus assembly protein PilW